MDLKKTGAGLAIAFVSLGVVAPSASAAPTAAPQVQTASVATAKVAKISRNELIKRAKTWLTANHGHQVPYSQSKTWGGYRTDCSGYVSMAAKLAKPGLNTVGLKKSATVAISKKSVKKGDLFIDAVGNNNTRHVVIFESWANKAHTKYNAYEQRGHYGTDHSVRSYGLSSGSEYQARRLKNITD